MFRAKSFPPFLLLSIVEKRAALLTGMEFGADEVVEVNCARGGSGGGDPGVYAAVLKRKLDLYCAAVAKTMVMVLLFKASQLIVAHQGSSLMLTVILRKIPTLLMQSG